MLKGDGVNLIGRDWLALIRLNWNKVFGKAAQGVNNLNSIKCKVADKRQSLLKRVLSKYSSIFSEGVGTLKNFKAKINVKMDAKPKFCRARPVPFSMKDAVEKEIDRLEREGILQSISYSEWASPIVIVPKPNGSLRICADFKNTVNPVI